MSSNTRTDNGNQSTCQCQEAGTVEITREGHHIPLPNTFSPSWLLQNTEYILDDLHENRFEPVIRDIDSAKSMLEKQGHISVTDDVAARIQRRVELWNERIHEYEDVVEQSRGHDMNGRAPQYYYDTDNEMIYVVVDSSCFNCDCDADEHGALASR